MSFRYILWMFAFMFVFLGVVLHQQDIENNRERNIFNYTQNIFIWNSSNFQTVEHNYTNATMTEVFSDRASNIIFKLLDLIGYTSFQAVKLGMEFGYEKAYKYDSDSFVLLAKLIFVVVIVSIIIPVIVPTLAFTYLLFEGFKWIIKKFKK